MSYAQAGQYQGAVTTLSGASVPRASVNVYLVGTTTRASLFTDATMATAAPNPAVADGAGNLGFYAAPGLYDLAYAGTTVTVEVSPNPADLQTSLNAAVQKAANLSDVNAATARTNLGLDTAATQPATAFDAAGAAAAVTTTSIGAATAAALATETTNRTNADAFLAPLASPSLTGVPTVNGVPIGGTIDGGNATSSTGVTISGGAAS